MRTVKVIGIQHNTPKTYNTGASTWGELKLVIDQDFPITSSHRVVVRETRADLIENDATLPDGDFTIFITEKSSKSGVDIVNFLEAFKEEFMTAFDSIIERVGDEEFGNTSTEITEEERDMLKRLSR